MARMIFLNNVAIGQYDADNNTFIISRMLQGDQANFHPKTVVSVEVAANQYAMRYIYRINGLTVYFLNLNEAEEISETEQEDKTI